MREKAELGTWSRCRIFKTCLNWWQLLIVLVLSHTIETRCITDQELLRGNFQWIFWNCKYSTLKRIIICSRLICKWNKEIQFSGYPVASIAVLALVCTSSSSRAKHIFPKLRSGAVLTGFFDTKCHVMRYLQTNKKWKKKMMWWCFCLYEKNCNSDFVCMTWSKEH